MAARRCHSNLDHCLRLRKLSLLGSHISDSSALLPLTELVEFRVSDAALDVLADVMSHSKLSDVAFYRCDLRGDFFLSFGKHGKIVSLRLEHCQLDSTEGLEKLNGLTELTLISSGA